MTTRTHKSTPSTPSQQKKSNPVEKCKSRTRKVRAGEPCPHCNVSKLEYNGLLQLSCPQCGVIEAGVST